MERDILDLINQLSQMELKLNAMDLSDSFNRNFLRIRESLKNQGFEYRNPLNEKYVETNTEMEATITGNVTENLVVKNVIKPVIYFQNHLVQRGIVVVEGNHENH